MGIVCYEGIDVILHNLRDFLVPAPAAIWGLY